MLHSTYQQQADVCANPRQQCLQSIAVCLQSRSFLEVSCFLCIDTIHKKKTKYSYSSIKSASCWQNFAFIPCTKVVVVDAVAAPPSNGGNTCELLLSLPCIHSRLCDERHWMRQSEGNSQPVQDSRVQTCDRSLRVPHRQSSARGSFHLGAVAPAVLASLV